MRDQITPREREAIDFYLKTTPYGLIWRPPGSSYDENSPNFVRKPTGWRRPMPNAERKKRSAQRLRIGNLLRAGRSMAEVAEILGTDLEGLEALAKSLQLKIPKPGKSSRERIRAEEARKRSAARAEKIVHMLESGMSLNKIAVELGCAPVTVRRDCKAHGIDPVAVRRAARDD